MPEMIVQTIERTQFIEVGTQGPPGTAVAKPALVVMDEVSSSVVYRGEAMSASAQMEDTVWRITRIEIIQSPLGTKEQVANFGYFNCAWTQRATYTYSDI
jgi:hypothetical protein